MPLDRVRQGIRHRPPPIYLLHGRADSVVPAEAAVQFAETCAQSEIRCSLSLVDSDHAGVVGTRYDQNLQACVASDGPAAITGLDAAIHAVRRALSAPVE